MSCPIRSKGRDAAIRVNAVALGLVDTEANIAALKPKDLKRRVKRQDIAHVAVLLASGVSAGITGQATVLWGSEYTHTREPYRSGRSSRDQHPVILPVATEQIGVTGVGIDQQPGEAPNPETRAVLAGVLRLP
ncbi:MAG: SDR family oxidoreductase [Gammaproteobacteria bacterium]